MKCPFTIIIISSLFGNFQIDRVTRCSDGSFPGFSRQAVDGARLFAIRNMLRLLSNFEQTQTSQVQKHVCVGRRVQFDIGVRRSDR